MRDAHHRSWRCWRITLAGPAATGNGANRLRVLATAVADRHGRDELPGPDGIRHELVARVRQEIAAGTYDTDEKWLLVEEELLRRIEERM